MVVYLIKEIYIDGLYRNTVFEGPCFLDKNKAEEYVKEHNKKCLSFDEIFNMSINDYNNLVEQKYKQLNFVFHEDCSDEEFDNISEEVIRLISKELNITLDLSREMFDFDKDNEQFPVIIEELELII